VSQKPAHIELQSLCSLRLTPFVAKKVWLATLKRALTPRTPSKLSQL